MRHLKDYWRLLGFFVNEFSSLEEIVVVKAVASALEQPAIGGQDEHLLAWAVFASLPEGLILIRHDQIIHIPVVLTIRVHLLLLVFFKLHVCQWLGQVKVYLIDVLDGIRKLVLLVLRIKLIHSVEY